MSAPALSPWRRLSRSLVEAPLPGLAVEVRPGAVSAVRLSREGGRAALGAAACVELPPGALAVSLTTPNVVDPAAFAAALRTALERAGALDGGPATLVLPDPAVRLALVSAEGLRGRGRETEETLRFRLHKSLPFDVRAARLAWRLVPDQQALVALAPEEVVRGYEEPLEALGLHPGLVEPSALALASGLPDGPGDRLLVNWDDGYVSFLILRDGDPVLARTLPGEATSEAVARHAAATAAFHRERLAGPGLSEVVVRAAAVPGEEALSVLGAALGCAPRLVAPWEALGAGDTGPSAQAVAGAAASVLRSAA